MAIQYDHTQVRPYTVLRTGIKPPSSNWSDIRCPFCEAVARAYWWSLCGGGKKCQCGVKFDGYGNAYPVKKPIKQTKGE